MSRTSKAMALGFPFTAMSASLTLLSAQRTSSGSASHVFPVRVQWRLTAPDTRKTVQEACRSTNLSGRTTSPLLCSSPCSVPPPSQPKTGCLVQLGSSFTHRPPLFVSRVWHAGGCSGNAEPTPTSLTVVAAIFLCAGTSTSDSPSHPLCQVGISGDRDL